MLFVPFSNQCLSKHTLIKLIFLSLQISSATSNISSNFNEQVKISQKQANTISNLEKLAEKISRDAAVYNENLWNASEKSSNDAEAPLILSRGAPAVSNKHWIEDDNVVSFHEIGTTGLYKVKRKSPVSITSLSNFNTNNFDNSGEEQTISKEEQRKIRKELRSQGMITSNKRRQERLKNQAKENTASTDSQEKTNPNQTKNKRKGKRLRQKEAENAASADKNKPQSQTESNSSKHKQPKIDDFDQTMSNHLQIIPAHIQDTQKFQEFSDSVEYDKISLEIQRLEAELNRIDPTGSPLPGNRYIPVTEIYDANMFPETFAYLSDSKFTVEKSHQEKSEIREKLAQLYKSQEEFLSNPRSYKLSIESDKKQPEKVAGPDVGELFAYKSALGFDPKVNWDSQAQNSQVLGGFHRSESAGFKSLEDIMSPNGCRYTDLPRVDEDGVDVNGEFTCSPGSDHCTLRCVTPLAWSGNGRGNKKIKCSATGEWVPYNSKKKDPYAKIPICSSICPEPNDARVLPAEGLKPNLNCFKAIGGTSCIPGVTCSHGDECYVNCPKGSVFDVAPNKNDLKCDCSGNKCKWLVGGERSLKMTSQCVETYGARIIGGYNADKDEHAQNIVSFGIFGVDTTKSTKKRTWQHMCGGVLLNAQWAFTAAHCKKAGLRAVVGEYKLNEKEGTEVPCRVQMQVRHPLYDGGTHNDIMMANLKCKKLVMGEVVMPAVLPMPGLEAPAGLTCTICGWGNTDYPNYQPAETLQCVDLPIIKAEVCNVNYANSIHDDIFCIGEIGVSGRDSCQGDSGGPALCGGVVYGLVMGGLYCAHPDYPGVYTKTSHYIKWAKNVIIHTQSRRSLYMNRRVKRAANMLL